MPFRRRGRRTTRFVNRPVYKSRVSELQFAHRAASGWTLGSWRTAGSPLVEMGAKDVRRMGTVTVNVVGSHSDTTATDVAGLSIGFLRANKSEGLAANTNLPDNDLERRVFGKRHWFQGGWQPPVQLEFSLKPMVFRPGGQLWVVTKLETARASDPAQLQIVAHFHYSIIDHETD